MEESCDERDRILDIAREARKRAPVRVPDRAREYVGLEAEAIEIKDFQNDLIPSLSRPRRTVEQSPAL